MTAFRQDGTSWAASGTATTALAGTYRLVGLHAGMYRVRFIDPKGKYIARYYVKATKIADAVSLKVRSAHTTWHIDVRLILKTVT